MGKRTKKSNRKNDNNSTLISVISKVKNIADTEYEGRVYDHILTIFNKLNTVEKRILLRGLINIVFIVEDKVVLNSTDLDHIRDLHKNTTDELKENNKNLNIHNDELLEEIRKIKKDIIKDEPSHEDINNELNKLRKMFMKASVILVGSIIVLMLVIVTEFSPEVYDKITRGIISALKYIILF